MKIRLSGLGVAMLVVFAAGIALMLFGSGTLAAIGLGVERSR